MNVLHKLFSLSRTRTHHVIAVAGVKIRIPRFAFQRVVPFGNDRPTLVFQLNIMDKGGLEEVVLRLASSVAIRQAFHVAIIAEWGADGHLAEEARARGIPVYSCFSKEKYLKRLIRKLNPRLVHFHYNLMGVRAYKELGVKTAYTIHNNYIWLDSQEVELRRTLYPAIDTFIAVSTQVRDYFCARFGIPTRRIRVIPNGMEYISPGTVTPAGRESIGMQKGDFIFLNIASFNLIKYHFAQVDALSKLVGPYPRLKLVILASIQDRGYYRQFSTYVKEMGMEQHVRVLDYVPRNEVLRYLKMADCFLMTSLSEGFSMAVLEAMLMQKPLILTDTGGARDVIDNADIGYIVKLPFADIQKICLHRIAGDCARGTYYFDNADDLSAAMEDMYLNRHAWRLKAAAGAEKVRKRFNLERMLAEHLELYRLTLCSPTPPLDETCKAP